MSFFKKAFSLACVLACFSGFISNGVSAGKVVYTAEAKRDPKDEYRLLVSEDSLVPESKQILRQFLELFPLVPLNKPVRSPFGFDNAPFFEVGKVIEGMEGREEVGIPLVKDGSLAFVVFESIVSPQMKKIVGRCRPTFNPDGTISLNLNGRPSSFPDSVVLTITEHTGFNPKKLFQEIKERAESRRHFRIQTERGSRIYFPCDEQTENEYDRLLQHLGAAFCLPSSVEE
ncbi:MAG: hypothetical protein LBK29_02445 [Oscillospiraceae bacterium]|jgi:hypothetical protein|nr:hypothetical protein [Oscillospiraceae bacterium]